MRQVSRRNAVGRECSLMAAGRPREDATQWLLHLAQQSSKPQSQVWAALLPASGALRAPAGDPNLPAGLLQSGPTASHDFSCFASTKRPFVISHTRASADVYGDRVGDGTRLTRVLRICRVNVGGCPDRSFRVRWGEGPLHP